MKTLIELYDLEPINNVYSADAIKPKEVIFVGGSEMTSRKTFLRKYLSEKGIEVHFEKCNPKDCDSVGKKILEIINTHPDSTLDLTGGSDEAIFAAGRLSAGCNIPFIRADVDKECVMGVYNAPQKVADGKEYTVEDRIRLAGGEIRGTGHFNLQKTCDKIGDKADLMWNIFMDFHTSWYKQVRYFQNAMRLCDADVIEAFREFDNMTCNMEIMHRLYNDGILSSLNTKGSKISFSFSDSDIRKLICDVGVWLEIYVYRTLLLCECINDARISVMIDWDAVQEEFDVLNEIDVLAQKGAKTIFISCKSGPVSVDAVNEVDILKNRFGGRYADAVIVTATNMSRDNLCVYKRAIELGIVVVEFEDLIEGNLSKIITRIP